MSQEFDNCNATIIALDGISDNEIFEKKITALEDSKAVDKKKHVDLKKNILEARKKYIEQVYAKYEKLILDAISERKCYVTIYDNNIARDFVNNELFKHMSPSFELTPNRELRINLEKIYNSKLIDNNRFVGAAYLEMQKLENTIIELIIEKIIETASNGDYSTKIKIGYINDEIKKNCN